MMDRISLFRKRNRAAPYEHLPAMYDRLMDHVDYAAWARYIVSVFTRFGRNVVRVVDGGCGTGSLMAAMKRMGFYIAGFDGSLGMVRRAKLKTNGPVWQGDLRRPALKDGWDAFLCLYDTIQYLHEEEIRYWLEEVGSILKPGGLVIFDMVTEAHVLKYWMDYIESIESEDWTLYRSTRYDRSQRILHTFFDLYFRKDKRLYTEHHRQVVYRLDALSRCWEGRRWSLLARHDGFHFDEGTESSDRIHIILKKEAG